MASQGPDSAGGLLNLRQGGRTVADYSIDFRTRARHSSWNGAAQCDAYLLGLESYVKDELVSYELPTTLDELIELTTRLDHRIQVRQDERQREWRSRRLPDQPQPPSAPMAAPQRHDPEPMQVGKTSLTSVERQRRRQGNLCLYCGQAGHFVARCPVKARTHQ